MKPERWRAIITHQDKGVGPFLWRNAFWLASLGYGIGIRYRNRQFDRGRNVTRVGVPVISVGNLTVGGTGKTPCVELVCRILTEAGLTTTILSRGYGNETGRNDEALLLEENLPDVPHLQGKNRVELAQTAIEELETEVIVLDDGMQHRKLHRDCNIVLLDTTDEGMGHLFPRGTLREPLYQLKRASIILLTHCDSGHTETMFQKLAEQYAPGVPVFRSTHQPVELLNGESSESPQLLSGKEVAAFCGIGNPESFRTTLQHLGCQVVQFREYPDHYAYQKTDIFSLQEWVKKLPPDMPVITTQKDWVKIRLNGISGHPLYALRVGLEIDNLPEFEEKVLQAAL
ncbi:MAG: tetraacyldisaccharide 4'-kinase [Zavarzinella sp.]